MHKQIHAVAEWASRKYSLPWQQDALRRVVENSKFAGADVSELTAMVEIEAKVCVPSDIPNPQPIVLGKEQPEGGADPGSPKPAEEASHPVILEKMHSLKHVNALAEGQSIAFAPQGMTVIYGENGAGKTGYSRVLRRAGRQWRKEDVVLVKSNVRTKSSGIPEAKFDVVAKQGEKPETVQWTQGKDAPKQLAELAVFDGNCAQLLIAKENQVFYQPEALGILPVFGKVLETVANGIGTKTASCRQKPTALTILDKYASDSEVGKYAARLGKGATLADLDVLVGDPAALEARLSSVRQQLASLSGKDGPETQAKAKEQAAARLGEAQGKLKSARETLDDAAVSQLSTAWKDRQAKQAAAQIASGKQFETGHLEGTGSSDAWKTLYKAAKAFSLTAYPGKDFPTVEAGSKCVWCQQTLDTNAAKRLQDFHTFVQDKTATEAQQAKEHFETLEKNVAAEIEDISDIQKAEFGGRSETLQAAWNVAFAQVKARRQAIVDACTSGQWDGLPNLAGLQAAEEALASQVQTLTQEAQEKRNLADPEAKKKLETERDVLEAKTTLHGVREPVEKYLQGLAQAKALETALGDCRTQSLSVEQGKFSEQFVTAELAKCLNEELKLLGAESHLAVKFDSRNVRGVTLNTLVLSDAVQSGGTHEVLSEGEQRVLALAAFLAELRLAKVPVGVIVDDPVTSLDHRWAEKIAGRLVQLGRERQVIVFTHNIHFALMLKDIATELRVVLQDHTVRRVGEQAGYCQPDAPWEAMTVAERITFLKKIKDEAKALHSASDPRYERDCDFFYSLMRATWERVVEERLFNKVVMRFQAAVKTQSLDSVVIADDDFQEVNNAMTRLSRDIRAHDHASASVSTTKTPEDMNTELTKLETYLSGLKKRKKEAEDRRAALKEPASST